MVYTKLTKTNTPHSARNEKWSALSQEGPEKKWESLSKILLYFLVFDSYLLPLSEFHLLSLSLLYSHFGQPIVLVYQLQTALSLVEGLLYYQVI